MPLKYDLSTTVAMKAAQQLQKARARILEQIPYGPMKVIPSGPTDTLDPQAILEELKRKVNAVPK